MRVGIGSTTDMWLTLLPSIDLSKNSAFQVGNIEIIISKKECIHSDSQVLLFLADDMACNGRNGAPGAVYHHRNKILDLYGKDVEVDFRGEEVTVQNLIRLLTGRQDKGG